MINYWGSGAHRSRGASLMTKFEHNMFARDLAAMLAIDDARKTENAAARKRCMNNPELVALLLDDALRRGKSEIDWPEYFRNIRICG